MARHHDIWVLTRSNNRRAIEAELEANPRPNLHFVYFDLPGWVTRWKRTYGIQVYYYLWQIAVYGTARRLHARVDFDIVHHVTFGKYWSPAPVSQLPVPFIWGTVGGGEEAPPSFRRSFNYRQRSFERLRRIAKWVGEHDPLVRSTARASRVALAATNETAARLHRLGCLNVVVEPQVAMSRSQYDYMSGLSGAANGTTRFISIGRPLHWKGFYLGLRAFAEAAIPESEYWMIANGPERHSLETLVSELKIGSKVRFIERLETMQEVYSVLANCHVLVHPALHEAFGNVVLEAMAAGKPVICLDLGGPAIQVTGETGVKVPALHPKQAISDMANAMRHLHQDAEARRQMGEKARTRVREEFSLEQKSRALASYYVSVTTAKIPEGH